MIKLLFIALGFILVLFLFCACVVSSRCSRLEEKEEYNHAKKSKKKYNVSKDEYERL